MEKERRVKSLVIVSLIVAVLGLTVAFAALSETLTINGTVNVETASWDIHFENMEVSTSNGVQASDPVINGTTINQLNVTLEKPNDMVTYSVDIKNTGTINAKISSVEVSPLCTLQSSVESCDWNNDGEVTQEDINKVNDNISFVVAYQDGSNINIGDILKKSETSKIGILIGYIKILNEDGTVSGYEEATELPKRNLQFNNLSVTINYVQSN